LVLCGAHRAEHVMVAGRWRVTNHRLVDQDLDTIQRRHRHQAELLLKQQG